MFMDRESVRKIKRSYTFTEYIGTLQQVEHRNSYITVFLSFAPHGESKHIFTFFHPEAETIVQKLQKLAGKKVGFLETSDPLDPIRVRVIDRRNSSSTPNNGV